MYLNYRKVMVAGATAAVIVGAGGTALAASGSDTTSGKASQQTTQKATGKHAGKHKGKGKDGGRLLRRLEHGQFVTKGKDGKTVTHDLIRGSVTSVSATSITVQAADKTSETFTVTKDTKVLAKTKGQKAAATTISKVAKGAQVLVAGTGTSTFTALHVLEVPTK